MTDIDREDIADWVDKFARGTWEAEWAAAIPPRFRNATVGALPPEVRNPIVRWAEAWQHDSPDAGALILTGPVGTGKTYAAVAAAREYEVPLFVPVVELLDSLRPGGDPTRFDRGGTVVQKGTLTAIDFGTTLARGLLILDDLGAQKDTDWTMERLYAIVNRRWMDEQPTIVTTNAPPDEMPEAFGPRVFSRLVDGATVVRLGGQDRRRGR